MRALDDLASAGKVRYIGASNFKAWQLMKSLAVSDAHGYARFVAGQYQHSLVVRDIEREFAELFLQEGLGSVPWAPLGGGFLSGKYRPEKVPEEGRLATTPDRDEEAWHRRDRERNWPILEVVDQIASQRGKSHAQISLAWLLARKEVSSIIVGARTPEQLADNLGASGWRLAEDEIDRLNDVPAVPLGYPYRMMELYGQR